VEFKYEAPEKLPLRDDALRGAKGRPSRIVKTFTSNPASLEELNWSLFRRYEIIKRDEVAFDSFMVDDAKLVVVAFGIAARIARGAIKNARKEGMRCAGLKGVPAASLRRLRRTRRRLRS